MAAVTTSFPQVLIIGGGLGGLALAQGLKNATPPIAFRIFERDAGVSWRAQGYRIRIVADALRKMLPPSLFAAFEASTGQVILQGHALSALNGKPTSDLHIPGPPRGKPNSGAGEKGAGPGAGPLFSGSKLYNADRAVLRNVLLKGLEDDIAFGKRFQSYRILDNGTVEAQFTDGTVEVGTLLVGADGTNSAVRRQLLPDFKLLDTEGRAIFGKTDLAEDIEAVIPQQILQGINLIGESMESSLRLFCETMKFRNPNAHSTGLDIPKDYIYWVLSFNRIELDKITGDRCSSIQQFLSLSNADAADVASLLTKSWHQSIRSFIDQPNADSTAALAFFICETNSLVQVWANLRENSTTKHHPVTLIGDAAHPMPPIGGVGANSAFEDAFEMYDCIKGIKSHQEPDYSKAVAAYEDAMVRRIEDTVEISAGGAKRFFGMKPMEQLKEVIEL